MTTPNTRPDGPTRRSAWVLGALVLVAASVTWWLSHETVAVDGRNDLLFDAERVEFVEGFDDRTELVVWNDVTGANPDRDEVALLMPRKGRLRWQVEARFGARLVTEVARRHIGPEEDRTPCFVAVRSLEAQDVRTRVPVPPVGANPAALAGSLREGASEPLELDLPAGIHTLEFEFQSPAGMPDGSLSLLLSPRILQPPRQVDVQQLAGELAHGERLLARFEPATKTRVLGQRRVEDADVEDVREPLHRAEGAFTGQEARPALAMLANTVVKLEIEVHADTVLRGALALDERMPSGASVDLTVRVNGKELATETIASKAWREVSVPLGDHAGPSRVLELILHDSRLEPDWVPGTEIDFEQGREVQVFHRARVVRAGFANPRLERPRAVSRRRATTRRPAVILIQVETLRADVLGCYGGEVNGLTPRIDAFARDAVVWDTAIAPSPWTLPTTVTLLTGLPPSAHGAVDHDRIAMPIGVATLAERAQGAGVATAAVASNDLLMPRKGFGWGFDDYAHVPYTNARQVNDLALGWIAAHAGQQFLLFLHYFDPHHPFNAPGAYRTRYVEPELLGRDVSRAPGELNRRLARGERIPVDDPDVRLLRQRYLGEVAWFDEQFGRLLDGLDALGLADDVVVVFTADHGEEFMEHGLHGHGSNMFDESLRVPLVIRAPGGQAGPARRVPGVVGTGGLFATVLELLDVPDDGPSFTPSLLSTDGPGFAFSETSKGVVLGGGGDPLRRWLTSVRTDDHLLTIRWPVEGVAEQEFLLFDLVTDPGATTALPDDAPARGPLEARMSRALQWCEDHRQDRMLPGGDRALAEALIQLGYLEGPGDREDDG